MCTVVVTKPGPKPFYPSFYPLTYYSTLESANTRFRKTAPSIPWNQIQEQRSGEEYGMTCCIFFSAPFIEATRISTVTVFEVRLAMDYQSRKDLKKVSLRDVMLRQGVENIWSFACFFSCWENPSKSLRAAEKSQGVAEKNKEIVEANCTGFSAEFFGSQSVEMFCFAKKTKIQMLTT